MHAEETLLLQRSDVAELLSLEDCIGAVEKIFRLQGEGKVPAPGILGVKAKNGGLHVKAGLLPGEKSYVVAKLNTNFPDNGTRFGLPTIQGVIVLYDAENGCPLAVLDSIDVTIKRTAAASAVAAKYLARKNSSVGTVCGCGDFVDGTSVTRHVDSSLECAFDGRRSRIFAIELRDLHVCELEVYVGRRSVGFRIEPEMSGELAAQHSSAAISVRSEVGISNVVGMEILRIGERNKADLIVIATHGMTGWNALGFGSVAEKIVRMAPSAVLVLRASPEKKR